MQVKLTHWTDEAVRLVKLAANNPDSVLGIVAVLLAAALGFMFVLSGAGKLLKVPMPELRRSLLVLAVTAILSLVVATAVGVLVAPRVRHDAIRNWLPAVSLAVVTLAAAVPLTCLIQRGTYAKSLVTLILALAAAAGIVLMVGAGLDAIGKGNRDMKKIQKRTRLTDGVVPR
jgi:hypothetical protein